MAPVCSEARECFKYDDLAGKLRLPTPATAEGVAGIADPGCETHECFKRPYSFAALQAHERYAPVSLGNVPTPGKHWRASLQVWVMLC